MEIDYLLEQIEFHNSSYEWVVRESEKIAKELKSLDLEVNFNADSYRKVTKRFLELEQRFIRNKKDYDNVLNQVRSYFNEKHGIDIIGILDSKEDSAK
jgi:predicted nuclease with TOPRIM domain